MDGATISKTIIMQSLSAKVMITLPSDKNILEEMSRYFLCFLNTNYFSCFESMRIAFEEALTNSLLHGNKYNINKFLKIILEANNDFVKVIIEDEGDGFDYAVAMIKLSSSQENIYQENGRGLFLISLYTDDFYFENGGKKIVLIKYREPPCVKSEGDV